MLGCYCYCILLLLSQSYYYWCSILLLIVVVLLLSCWYHIHVVILNVLLLLWLLVLLLCCFDVCCYCCFVDLTCCCNCFIFGCLNCCYCYVVFVLLLLFYLLFLIVVVLCCCCCCCYTSCCCHNCCFCCYRNCCFVLVFWVCCCCVLLLCCKQARGRERKNSKKGGPKTGTTSGQNQKGQLCLQMWKLRCFCFRFCCLYVLVFKKGFSQFGAPFWGDLGVNKWATVGSISGPHLGSWCLRPYGLLVDPRCMFSKCSLTFFNYLILFAERRRILKMWPANWPDKGQNVDHVLTLQHQRMYVCVYIYVVGRVAHAPPCGAPKAMPFGSLVCFGLCHTMFALCSMIFLQIRAAKCWDNPSRVLGFARFYGLVLRQGGGWGQFPLGVGVSHGPLRPIDWLSWPDSKCASGLDFMWANSQWLEKCPFKLILCLRFFITFYGIDFCVEVLFKKQK